ISYGIYGLLAVLLAQQILKIVRVNRSVIAREPVPHEERYSFRQVAILCLCYAVTFGGELAVEQMLPAYFEKMFHVSVVVAGLIGAYGSVGSVAFMTILLLTNPLTFFLCMAGTSAAAFLCCFLLSEPVARPAGILQAAPPAAAAEAIEMAVA